MVEITLDTSKFQYLSAFANLMGKVATDVEFKGDEVIFFVPESEFRDIFSKENKYKLRLLEKLLKKKIIVKPFAFDPVSLAKIILGRKRRILEIYIAKRDDGSKVLRIRLDRKSKISGRLLRHLRETIKKYFPDIQEVIVNV